MARVKSRTRERSRRIHLPTSIGQTAMALPQIAEEGFAEKEPLPVLAIVPEIPRRENIAIKSASDLALDLVLNEIVLQARLTTNATGAVLALARTGGELVCRATTGATASDVAIGLRTKLGIAATCFATGAVRRVDDLEPDPNEDAVAYRRSGVRSILVVPVQGEKGPLLGILEIFSPRANAFCDRDALTLQALARRIAANVELVQQSTFPTTRPQTSANLESANLDEKARALKKARQARFNFQVPRFLTGILAQRSRFASTDWIAVLARTSVALVLIAGSMLARSCWQRSGSVQLVQVIRGPMTQISKPPAQHPVIPVASNEPTLPTTTHVVDPSAWPPRVSAHTEITSSITIQRQPVRRHELPPTTEEKPDMKSGASGDLVLFENHGTVPKTRRTLESKSSSKDPAATVLPNKDGEAVGNSSIEVLSSQSALARLLQRVEPEYPNAARQQHIQGTVVLDVVVDKSGAVDGLSQVSGESQLMVAAAQAVRQWHFQPMLKDGKPTKFESRIAIDFTLASDSPAPSH